MTETGLSSVETNQDFSHVLNEEGKVQYVPELFTPPFQERFSIYERAALAEVRLRGIRGGNTNEYSDADFRRREAHNNAAMQLQADLLVEGRDISFEEARRIVNKMLENKFPGTDEIDMLSKAFLRDRD